MTAASRRDTLRAVAGILLAVAWPFGSGVRAHDGHPPDSADVSRGRADPHATGPGPEDLLAHGEALLAAGQAEAALEILQRAAHMAHTPQIECTIVRAQVQAGAYRQALAFGAHAALAHRGHPSATALYAWLLHAGGQSVIATRLLVDALQRTPDDLALRLARSELATPWPRPSGPLSSAPYRCAPYTHGDAVSSETVRCTGTGMLGADGRSALVPRTALGRLDACWLRNGLGRTVHAKVSGHAGGMALLRLEHDLPPAAAAAVSSPVFAGSPLATAEFVPCDSADAAWPVLHLGFAGKVPARGARALGIALPAGPRGGPVFDRAGRLAGVAMAQEGVDTLVNIADLPAGYAPAATAPAAVSLTIALDATYESALHLALQVLTSRI